MKRRKKEKKKKTKPDYRMVGLIIIGRIPGNL